MINLWEILVPTVRRKDPDRYYRKRYHKVWDAKVREIAGGLTVLKPVHGEWISPGGELFAERMIPVRICCTAEQMELIASMTMHYYDQICCLYYRISDYVVFKYADPPS